MACGDVYAHPFDYGVIWQCESVISGLVTAGASSSNLTDDSQDFLVLDVPVGAPVYNVTTHQYGYVTSVAQHVLGTSSTLWTIGDSYQIAFMQPEEVATVLSFLRISSGDINAALGAVGAINCSKTCADAFLRKLTVVLAATIHKCPCARPNLQENERMQFLQWSNEMLRVIWTGELELCDGETGTNFPAIGIAQQGWTAWRDAEIIVDSLLRLGV